MNAKKFAISIPAEVMKQVDRAARARQVTRSRFISDVLRKVAAARSDAEVSRRVNAVFEDEDVAREQVETSNAFLSGHRGRW